MSPSLSMKGMKYGMKMMTAETRIYMKIWLIWSSQLTDLLHPYFSVAPWFETKEGESLTKEKGDNVTMNCSAQGFPLMVEWKVKFSNNETVLPCVGKVNMTLSHPIP